MRAKHCIRICRGKVREGSGVAASQVGDSRHLGHIHNKEALTVCLCALDAHTIPWFTALQGRGTVDLHNGHPVVANVSQTQVESVVFIDVIYRTMSWVRQIPKGPFTVKKKKSGSANVGIEANCGTYSKKLAPSALSVRVKLREFCLFKTRFA
jgi:hypothetical protein